MRDGSISINAPRMRSLQRIDGVWSAWIAIALLSVLARAIVPAGYMAAAERGPGFTICSSQFAVAGAQKDVDPYHSGKSSNASCPFAMLQLAVDTPVSPTIGAPVTAYSVTATSPELHLAPGRGLAAPPPPSTGPPTLL